ncbi:MAG: hypothetical protein H6727_05855 [Myxococcales bacterium]|nr:hypothetical protein [Myxococcales bacterium]
MSKKKSRPKSPLLVESRIPFATTLVAGLGAIVTGLFLIGDEPFAANICLSAGTSVLFSSVSSYMWWGPNLYLGMLGSLLGTVSLVGGIILATGVTGAPVEMGWGLLGATLVHLIFNLVGWLNLRVLLGAKKKKQHAATKVSMTPPWDVQVAPYITSKQAGLSCFVTF